MLPKITTVNPFLLSLRCVRSWARLSRHGHVPGWRRASARPYPGLPRLPARTRQQLGLDCGWGLERKGRRGAGGLVPRGRDAHHIPDQRLMIPSGESRPLCQTPSTSSPLLPPQHLLSPSSQRSHGGQGGPETGPSHGAQGQAGLVPRGCSAHSHTPTGALTHVHSTHACKAAWIPGVRTWV